MPVRLCKNYNPRTNECSSVPREYKDDYVRCGYWGILDQSICKGFIDPEAQCYKAECSKKATHTIDLTYSDKTTTRVLVCTWHVQTLMRESENSYNALETTHLQKI